MPWYFAIEDFPEVQSLPTQTRKTLLKKSKTPGRIRLLFAAGWRALLLSIVLSGLVHAILVSNQLDRVDLILSPPLFLVLFLGLMAVFHYWIMMRYRGRLRASIREASRGERSPICLKCGHDLTGIDSQFCPECGTTASIPNAE